MISGLAGAVGPADFRSSALGLPVPGAAAEVSLCVSLEEKLLGGPVEEVGLLDDGAYGAFAEWVGVPGSSPPCGPVWPQNLERGHRVAQAMRVGTFWVNTWYLRGLRSPFGGAGLSGIGREGGRHSLYFHARPTDVCVQLGPRRGQERP